MVAINYLVARDESAAGNPVITNKLLIALISLVFIVAMLLAVLLFLRWRRRSRQADREALTEEFNEKQLFGLPPAIVPGNRNARRLTITTSSESVFVIEEKQKLMAMSSSPPTSPVPEIRITFPEEVDEAGKRQSGRVVVVRVGEHGVGLEPVREDDLPPYQCDVNERFQSLDLERIGGLKEKI